ncbi:hypothetical protein A2W14_05365 [Candidatus Gottesmanbacteria bacterium RBG_16_37_8]|uniref:DUF4349 domain-containing protein n=1 Tax=Candidatus Gottesmanbacteria bacterium RBG_16_37_8 TaxID=1798371 RepID=A0A1F5YTL4_9BACT|nr:MAG: hypothetical protein A2W14_05365 [Candidatus Gottesmanbacteria bacterium RBG_16_37_8]
MKIWEYIKSHKITSLLILVIIYLLYKNSGGIVPLRPNTYDSAPMTGVSEGMSLKLGSPSYMGRGIVPPQPDYAPAPDVTDRKVISESQLSIQVKNVRDATDKIMTFAKRIGGYMVNTSLSNPGEAPSGYIVIRVPQAKFDESLIFLRSLGIKVVWENLTGEDVTDQYVDLDARIATLNRTLLKFQELFNKAVEISDILNIQREIINIQEQIDSLKGQQNFLDKSALMAKISVNLSTDEFSLPYAPTDTFRPEVIFKQAVRSLVDQLRKVGTWIIWLTVYAVVWVPVLLIVLYIKGKYSSKRTVKK